MFAALVKVSAYGVTRAGVSVFFGNFLHPLEMVPGAFRSSIAEMRQPAQSARNQMLGGHPAGGAEIQANAGSLRVNRRIVPHVNDGNRRFADGIIAISRNPTDDAIEMLTIRQLDFRIV